MLTLQQCGQRAATRKNNRLKRTLPLLADQWSTTPEAEVVRIAQQRAAAQAHLTRLAEADAQQWRVGEERRAIAAEVLPAEAWQHYADLWKKTYPGATPETQGAQLADWWWQALRSTSWAFEHCPNQARHDDPAWWTPRWHFLRESFVETLACPTCGMPCPW
jgi:hypothetical protein